jgi:hypothetical protein
MVIPHAALVSAFRRALFKATPNLTIPDEVIDGFPEYAFTIDTINDPTVKAKLRALARKIVASHQTSKRIIGFEVHGHADVALRIPKGPERERTEKDVSRDRAENAKDLLLQMIAEEGGKPIIAGIRANAEAHHFGAQFTKFNPARTEAEMRRNRRVEIFLKVLNQPQPKPVPPPPPPAPKPLPTGSHWRVQIKSGNVTSVNLHNDLIPAPVNFFFKIEITDLDRKQKASFHAHARGISLPLSSAITNAQTVMVPEGPARDFATVGGGVTLSSFNGALTIAQNPSISVGVSKGGAFVFDFEGINPVVTTPRVVELEGGSPSSLNLPQFSTGVAPSPEKGSLSMQGSPVAVQ